MFDVYYTQRYFLDVKDIILTPIYFIIFVFILQIVSLKENKENRRLFFYAGIAKLIASIFFGLIYFFVYGSGDTSLYFSYGKIINISFFEEGPLFFLKIMFSNGEFDPDTNKITRYMEWYSDSSSFLIVKIVAVLCFFTFQTYMPIAMIFSLFSFWGLWLFFLIMANENPTLKKYIWFGIFFLPSTLFWSSGILKDGIVLSCLCLAYYGFYKIFYKGIFRLIYFIYMFLGAYLVLYIKSYVLICFLPLFIFPFVHRQLKSPKRSILFKLLVIVFFVSGTTYGFYNLFYSEKWKNEFKELSESIAATANYIYYMSEITGGSAYSLGKLDGSIESVISKAHLAVFTTLYRPFIWESKNMTMFLSAVESSYLLLVTLYLIIAGNKKFILYKFKTDAFFSSTVICTVIFGTLVGVSSYNFGTLVRYKIPLLPFFISMLFLLVYPHASKSKKYNI